MDIWYFSSNVQIIDKSDICNVLYFSPVFLVLVFIAIQYTPTLTVQFSALKYIIIWWLTPGGIKAHVNKICTIFLQKLIFTFHIRYLMKHAIPLLKVSKLIFHFYEWLLYSCAVNEKPCLFKTPLSSHKHLDYILTVELESYPNLTCKWQIPNMSAMMSMLSTTRLSNQIEL